MQWKKRWNKGWHIHGAPGGGYSIGSRLALYWLCLVLAALAAVLCGRLGPAGVWHAFWITEVLTALVAYPVYHRAAARH